MQQQLFDIEQVIKSSQVKGEGKVLTPETQKMLRTIASIGMNAKVLACLLEMAEVDKQLIRYLAGPILTAGNHWKDSIPKWVIDAVAIDRLDIILEEVNKGEIGELATPSEVIAVMMPITFEAPLTFQWTNVYLWASHETISKHKPFPNYNYDHLWEKLGIKPVDYEQIKHNYEYLARDIRSRVIKHSSKEWGTKLKKHNLQAQQEDKPIFENDAQLSLFNC